MDTTSYEELNRGKRNLVILILVVLTSIGIIAGLFTNYKYETLICKKRADVCYVEKTNMLNSKRKTDLTSVSNIKYATYVPERVSGNAYAKGYTAYFLNFQTKMGDKIQIFSTEYYDENEIKTVIADLNSKLKDNNVKIIKIIRKL